VTELQTRIEEWVASGTPADTTEVVASVQTLLRGLEQGEIRAASPHNGEWRANAWVKQGILLAFRVGQNERSTFGPFGFADKHTMPPRRVDDLPRDVRIVPGGTTVRAGAHIAAGAIIMPPAYVNVGAFVGEGSLIDSHALVGSCAQIGRRVHLSAAAQIGGVLEPASQLPVIVEDDVLVGGNSGLYEGVVVRHHAVIGAGVILTQSTPIHDLVHGRLVTANDRGVLEVPAGAVVVMGSRPARGDYASGHGLQIATPLIVKYRDERTDARVALEQALRG